MKERAAVMKASTSWSTALHGLRVWRNVRRAGTRVSTSMCSDAMCSFSAETFEGLGELDEDGETEDLRL